MHFIVSLLPVIVFLLVLLYLDSFKLVRHTLLIICFLWGISGAGIAYIVNTAMMENLMIEGDSYSKYISPWVEEAIKMMLLVFLAKKNRMGFIIDGAIYGFAIGAGFAVVENIYYLYEEHATSFLINVVRGFGTAIMHGGTTSVAAMIIMKNIERKKSIWRSSFLALFIAVILHSFFNHFIFPPLIMTVFILCIITLIEVVIFRYNKKVVQNWLELEFDREVKLLMMIKQGKFTQTRSGEYLMLIKDKFSKLVVVDMLAYIDLYLELSIRAKSNLMLHETGLPVNRDNQIRNKLSELNTLQKNIGKTGLLAISPILRLSRKDLWKWSLV